MPPLHKQNPRPDLQMSQSPDRRTNGWVASTLLRALRGGARVAGVNSGDIDMRTFILASIAVLAIGSNAMAAVCKDPVTHRFIKCAVVVAPAPAAVVVKGPAPAVVIVKGPHCVKGKACGNSCIAMDKVCHKPS
jgi:hypothetical protein